VRHIRLIGIGAGDPEHLTLQAVRALAGVEVFFAFDKARSTDRPADPLVELRRALIEHHREPGTYRFVALEDPARDRRPVDYLDTVADWHGRRAELLSDAIERELGTDGVGAILVWGDPGLYDSTIRIVERVLALGRVNFGWEVIPGITSIQALTARHRIPLNRAGEEIVITTARRLPESLEQGHRNVVVMLDPDFELPEATSMMNIYWGAYLGTPQELLDNGSVAEAGARIARRRRQARAEHGWIMDTYLLRSADSAAATSEIHSST
jgi:precorrin-6A synthase